MKRKIIHNDLIKSVIIPVTFACLMLAACFSLLLEYFHNKHIGAQIRLAHKFLMVNQITQQQEISSGNLKSASRAILAMPIFKCVYIFNDKAKVTDLGGLPDNVDNRQLREAAQKHPANEIFIYQNFKYVQLPLHDNYFAIVGLSQSIFDINRYKGLIIIISVFFFCILILQFFIRSFNRAIFSSIRLIERGISDLIAFNYNKKIPPTDIDSFKPLTNMVNKLSEIQRRISEQAINDIEQSTSELRETLETVEMQNIELDIARKNATEASRVKSQFLANTSHEVRTPLNGILGFSQLLKKTKLDKQQTEYLETIESSSKGLLTVMNDILDFSRLDIGSLNLDYKPIKLRELINETLMLYSNTADEKHLWLFTFVEHDVPEELLGDPLRLKQILGNLISNAIKFSESGYISISVHKDDSIKNHFSLRFEIQDKGVGLTDEQKNRIFNPFIQLDASESRLNGGIGLGLAIAKGLVEKMHGSIGVHSKINQGSTFWFTLALGRNLNINHSQFFLYDTLRNIHALVYDANEEGRREIVHYIDGWGADATTVDNMDDILSTCKQLQKRNPPTVIILDSYYRQYEFNKVKLRQTIANINASYNIPVFIFGSKSIQRVVDSILEDLDYTFINRPLLSNKLHQKICENLNISSSEEYQEKFDLLEIERTPAKDIHILVVDDNPANLKLVTELLKGLNVQVTSVDSGDQAIEHFKTSQFDLVFMDIQMPGMDGLEATRIIREVEKKYTERTPVIALTAHAVSGQKHKLLLSGLDDALSKPVSEIEIKHTIERWTGERLQSSRTFNTSRPKPRLMTVDNTEKTSELKTIDIALGLSLANNNPALAKDMLAMLIESLDDTAKNITLAQDQNNLKEIEELVHKLYGGCCYTGVPKLKDISHKIDNNFQGNDTGKLDTHLSHLLKEINTLQEWAQSHDISALYETDDTTIETTNEPKW